MTSAAPVHSLNSETIFDTVADLVGFAPRATGSIGGKRTVEYVVDRFRAAGIPDVRILEEPSHSWRADRCELRIDGDTVACAPIRHCGVWDEHHVGDLVTEPASGRIADIGDGEVPGDVRGAIVLFDLSFEVELKKMDLLSEYKYDPRGVYRRPDIRTSRNPFQTSMLRIMEAAAAAGAVGVIGVLRDYPESLAYRNESFPEEPMALPGVWITRSTGEFLRSRLTPSSQAVLDMHIAQDEVTSQTVIGILPGRTRETVMIQSHHDSVTPGAVEDASGTAEVIALAEHFGQLAREGHRREKTLMFTTFDTHFTGYQAHRRFCDDYLLAADPELDIMLNVTIEHVGLRAVRGADGGFTVLDESEPRGLFENLNIAWKFRLARLLKRHDLAGTALLFGTALEFTDDGIPTDAAYTMALGVPTVSLICGPLYLYDDEDTLDKIDVDQLGPVARFFAALVEAADRSRPNWIGLIPRPLRRLLPRWHW